MENPPPGGRKPGLTCFSNANWAVDCWSGFSQGSVVKNYFRRYLQHQIEGVIVIGGKSARPVELRLSLDGGKSPSG